MEPEKLKEYLEIVVDMEKNVFLQKNILKQIEHRISELKSPQNFLDPAVPVPPSKDFSIGSLLLLIIVVCPVIWCFTVVLIIIMTNNIDDTNLPESTGIILLILSFIPSIIFAYKKIQDYLDKKALFEYKLFLYNKDVNLYQQELHKVELCRQQDKTDREAQILMLQKASEQIKKILASSDAHLRSIYDENIIYIKYRNMAMVSSLCEYISSCRCTTLEGHEGAYNILEKEIRLDRIVLQLDKIISQLQQIKENQIVLYSAVLEANLQSRKILDSTYRIVDSLQGLNTQTNELNDRIAKLQASSALTSYYAERMQKELAYMNRMDYLSGRNDGVPFNQPPV